MELDMLNDLLARLNSECGLADVSALHHLVSSREIEDIENLHLKNICETIWITLFRCWSTKEYSEKERMAWEIVSLFLSLPAFTSKEEDLKQIGSTVKKELCQKCNTE
jgi:hypothetical protein